MEAKIIDLYLSGNSSETIAKQYNIHPSTVLRLLKKHNIPTRSANINKIKYLKKENWLEEINTEEKAYFLGLMISDGTIHSKRNAVSIGLLESDKHVLEKFSNLVYNQNLVKVYTVKNSKNNCAKLSFYGPTFKNNLIKHGCFPQKTFKTIYPIIPDFLDNHFLRGIYDGDGCIYNGKNKKIVDLVCTEDLANDIDCIINKKHNMNIRFNLYKGKKHNKTICSFRIDRFADCESFLKFIYRDSTIHIDRKFKSYLKFCELTHDI